MKSKVARVGSTTVCLLTSKAMKSRKGFESKSMAATFSAGKRKRSSVRVSVVGVTRKFSITWLMCWISSKPCSTTLARA